MNKATRAYASTFGAIMALAGVEHGIGEILQGNVTPGGIMVQSWPESDFLRGLGGEPALTILPNLLITGILAVLVSLALLVWAVFFVHRKNGGWIMMLLSGAMLLVGGGIFPPVFGVLIGAVATQIHSPLTWWSTHLSPGARRTLAGLWPWAYAAGIIAWPCVFLVGALFGETAPLLLLANLAIALGALILTVFCGFARDVQHPGGERAYTPAGQRKGNRLAST